MTLQPCVPCESAPFRRWGEVELHIVSLAGRELTSVVIDTNGIVATLKDRIEKSKNFPLDKRVQSLVFDGRNLRNADVLESYGFRHGDTVLALCESCETRSLPQMRTEKFDLRWGDFEGFARGCPCCQEEWTPISFAGSALEGHLNLESRACCERFAPPEWHDWGLDDYIGEGLYYCWLCYGTQWTFRCDVGSRQQGMDGYWEWPLTLYEVFDWEESVKVGTVEYDEEMIWFGEDGDDYDEDYVVVSESYMYDEEYEMQTKEAVTRSFEGRLLVNQSDPLQRVIVVPALELVMVDAPRLVQERSLFNRFQEGMKKKTKKIIAEKPEDLSADTIEDLLELYGGCPHVQRSGGKGDNVHVRKVDKHGHQKIDKPRLCDERPKSHMAKIDRRLSRKRQKIDVAWLRSEKALTNFMGFL